MDRRTVTKKEIAAAIATKTAMPITQVGEVVQLWMDRLIEELWPDDASFDELSRQRIINQSALKRVGEPDDIAKAVDFLATAAPYVTGQVITVDGGRSITL